MTDIIQRFFSPTALSVREFFEKPGVGYYIPLYQREYSWGKDNIDQLMEDLCQGVQMLVLDGDTIRFLGTVILVRENNAEGNVKPKEPRALPPTIHNIIDGQQRISTIALLACLLYRRLDEVLSKIPAGQGDWYQELREQIDIRKGNLLEVFSFDLKLGSPSRKPIIIRGATDSWTVSGDAQLSYKSDITSYIAAYIKAVGDRTTLPPIPNTPLMGVNLKLMNDWLDKIVYSHDPSRLTSRHQDKDDFLPAWDLISPMARLDSRSFGWPEMASVITGRGAKLSEVESAVCTTVQIFALCYFLLERCCFTTIIPISEENAFDMFQSLNATGTPLTAIETFKPFVFNKATDDGGYHGSLSELYFQQVEALFEVKPTYTEKTSLTNEFLNTFALAQEGIGLPRQFSKQRRWLKQQYEGCGTKDGREEFMHRMGDLAAYWEQVIGFNPQSASCIQGTESTTISSRREAAFCMLYLVDANHVRAHTVLSRFYSLLIRGITGYNQAFVDAVRAVAAFYTLWRSAYNNTGLDAVYERMLQSHMAWKHGNDQVTVDYLKSFLREELRKKLGITSLAKANWMIQATQELRYDLARPMCKFALFVTAHDSIPDSTMPGLLKQGVSNTYPYIDSAKWHGAEFKSIEHIAPQKPDAGSSWDQEIYLNGDQQRIGNLVLLPVEINSSAGNKQWAQKWFYYKHLAEVDPDKLVDLGEQASKRGISLKDKPKELLQKAGHNHHMAPIVNIGPDDSWGRDIITKRTERICSILWDRIYPWLI